MCKKKIDFPDSFIFCYPLVVLEKNDYNLCIHHPVTMVTDDESIGYVSLSIFSHYCLDHHCFYIIKKIVPHDFNTSKSDFLEYGLI